MIWERPTTRNHGTGREDKALSALTGSAKRKCDRLFYCIREMWLVMQDHLKLKSFSENVRYLNV
jgi:hypothetical protein